MLVDRIHIDLHRAYQVVTKFEVADRTDRGPILIPYRKEFVALIEKILLNGHATTPELSNFLVMIQTKG